MALKKRKLKKALFKYYKKFKKKQKKSKERKVWVKQHFQESKIKSCIPPNFSKHTCPRSRLYEKNWLTLPDHTSSLREDHNRENYFSYMIT